MNVAVRDHYRSKNIVARLLAALRTERGPDVPIAPDTLAPLDHFDRGGLAATRKLADIANMTATIRYNDFTEAELHSPAVKDRFNAVSARVDGIFDQPVRVDLLRP